MATDANGRWLALIGLAVLLIAAARLPFLSQVLIDEEGSHAHLVLGTEPVMRGNLGLLIARVDGVDVLGSVERNPLPYLFIDRVMRGWLGPGNVDGWPIAAISRAARLPFLAMFMIGCLAFAAVAVRAGLGRDAPTRAAIALALAYAMTAPIVVGGSIQPQLDGSIGVLVVGVAGALIVAGPRIAGPAAIACSFAGGFVGGLGKTEWAAAFAGALLAALVARWLWMRRRGGAAPPAATRADTVAAVAAIAGVATAFACVATAAPDALGGGLGIAARIARTGANPFTVLRGQLRLTYPLIVLAVPALALAVTRLDRLLMQHLVLTVTLIWGLAIGTAYFLAGWAGDGFPRYYVPAIALTGLSLVGMLAAVEPPRWLTRAVIGVAAIGLVANAASLTERTIVQRSITSVPGLSLAAMEQRFADNARRFAERPQIFFESASFGIYFPNVDFASAALGYDGAVALVRRHKPGFAGELTRP